MNTASRSFYDLLHFFWYFPYFFFWWYVSQLIFWVRFIWRTILLVADGVSIGPMVRYLFAPYHQDRTMVGYFMGFILRTIWIATSLVIIGISLILLLPLLPLHLIGPFGFYFGMALSTYFDVPWQQNLVVIIGWLVTLSTVFSYVKNYVIQPKKMINQIDVSRDIDFRMLEETFMPRLKRDWDKAFKLASQHDNLEELSYFLFLVMILDRRNLPIFYRLRLNPNEVYKKAKEQEFNLKKAFIPLSELLRKEIEVAKEVGHKHLDSDVLLVTLVKYNKAIHELFIEMGVSDEEFKQTSEWIYNEIKRKHAWRYWEKPTFTLHGGYDRAWTSAWTPTLKHYSQNITELVSSGRASKMIGRKQEVEQIMRILTRTTKNNVILLGPAGVGKTAIAYGIAQQMLTGEAKELKSKKLVAVDFPSLIGGTGSRGDFELRFKKILDESGPGGTILFIDEMGSVAHAGGGEGSIDAAAVLSPYLSSGVIQCIGTTSHADYRKYIEPNTTFSSFFQTVEIKEPSYEEAVKILESFCPQIESKQGVTITFQAIEAAIKLSSQYLRDRVLPEKAIDILDETAVGVRRQNLRFVTADHVAEVISLKTGVPVTKLNRSEKDKLLNLEKRLHERIIGQEEAIEVIANAMRRARVGLKDVHKPVARFLFLGPTGVGKTETCKALADIYYGNENNMIRLDMSEYQDASSLSRMLGAPPGSKDFEAGGQLTEAVRRRPFSLVLLDELEKAHPRILDVFLQVLDDGRLTDSSGRVISFQDSIIIATSNAQAVMIQEAVRKGYNHDQLKSLVMEKLNQTFRPEFLNRFDAIVVYKPLAMEQVLQIAVLMLQQVRNYLKEKEIGFEISPEALVKITKLGFNPEFGARPLRRVIQERIENKLAQKILEGEIKEGDVVKIQETDI